MPLDGLELGRYHILRLIGSGGMGEIYLAEDIRIHRQVAIKVIRAEATGYPDANATKEAARLFQREMRAIITLDHPHILPLYDFGEATVNRSTLTYMVMPYRQEGSLADWLQARGSEELLSPQDVGYLLQQAASALQHAHNRQIIHQDVKPSNLLIQSREEEPDRPNLMLADFGVAKFTSATSSMSHTIRGTPTYMAPEQWDGQPVPATDQYALAVMAYELLTGCPPFMGNGYQHMWHQHNHIQPSPPSSINPLLPQELDAVFLRALEKKPERRFSSVSAFAHAFQRAVLNSGNVHQILTITALEARTGTNRLLPLPGGRQVIVPIPPGVNHGQVIRLEGFGRPTTYNNPVGALIVTISIAPVVAEEAVSPTTPTFQHTVAVSNSLARNEVKPTLPRVPIKKRNVKAKATMVMSIAFVLVLLSGMISIYAIISTGAPLKSTAATSTPTPDPNRVYPTYIISPKTGSFAFSDSLKDDSKGNNWASTPSHTTLHGSCKFTDNALHVTVNGETGVTFHTCIPEPLSTASNSVIFSNFAYQVKMTFDTGDCGGVTFRGQGEGFYYFFICRNSNYSCYNDSTKVCNYGLIRYTNDPSSGKPDFKLNPLLTEGLL